MRTTNMKQLLHLTLICFAVLICACNQAGEEPGKSDKADNTSHLGDPHAHSHTPHVGVMAAFKEGGKDVGFVELKLHDDKGDLELWITTDQKGKEPFDLPLDAVIKVQLPKLEKTVELKVRNTEKNEDEDGNGNIRDGKTNYFIFPGDTGADAKFLMGKDFSSEAIISFELDGKSYTSEGFALEPHVH